MTTSFKSLQGEWYQENAVEGSLRVYCFVNPPSVPFYHRIETADDAMALIDLEADIQLSDPAVGSNVFGLQIYHQSTGEWEEWEDADGNSIDDIMDAREA